MSSAEARLADLDVLRRGHFRLSSGKHSDAYLQCALALQDPSTALHLGRELAARLPDRDVDVVASPALGGVVAGFVVAAALGCRFAFTERGPDRQMMLRRGQSIGAGERVLVVEDVITTGGSAMEVVALCESAGATVAGVASLVDRSAGLRPHERPPISPTSLLVVEAQTWPAEQCPVCAAGTPLDTPGSRHAA